MCSPECNPSFRFGLPPLAYHMAMRCWRRALGAAICGLDCKEPTLRDGRDSVAGFQSEFDSEVVGAWL